MESFKVIDTHTHYSLKRFDHVRKELMSELQKKGILAVIEAGIDFSLNPCILEFCQQYDFMYAALGVHPKFVENFDEIKFEQLEEMLGQSEKILAVGETGLDYFIGIEKKTKELQKKWFRKLIELAIREKKPLVIHCRDAYPDLLTILSEYHLPEKPGVIHCFSGTLEEAEQLIHLGFYLGMGGKFMRDEALEKVIKEIPAEKMLLETDAPYLSPVKNEKNNTSLNLELIVAELVKLKGMEREVFLKMMLENTYDLYPQLEKIEQKQDK